MVADAAITLLLCCVTTCIGSAFESEITFKLCLLVYKATRGLAPSYIADMCIPVTTVSTRQSLRSAARGDLLVPRTRVKFGNRAFAVAGL